MWFSSISLSLRVAEWERERVSERKCHIDYSLIFNKMIIRIIIINNDHDWEWCKKKKFGFFPWIKTETHLLSIILPSTWLIRMCCPFWNQFEFSNPMMDRDHWFFFQFCPRDQGILLIIMTITTTTTRRRRSCHCYPNDQYYSIAPTIDVATDDDDHDNDNQPRWLFDSEKNLVWSYIKSAWMKSKIIIIISISCVCLCATLSQNLF